MTLALIVGMGVSLIMFYSFGFLSGAVWAGRRDADLVFKDYCVLCDATTEHVGSACIEHEARGSLASLATTRQPKRRSP